MMHMVAAPMMVWFATASWRASSSAEGGGGAALVRSFSDWMVWRTYGRRTYLMWCKGL